MPFQKKKRAIDHGTIAFVVAAFAIAGVATGFMTGGTFQAQILGNPQTNASISQTIAELLGLLEQQRELSRQMDEVMARIPGAQGFPLSGLTPHGETEEYCGDGICNGEETGSCGVDPAQDMQGYCPNACPTDCDSLSGAMPGGTPQAPGSNAGQQDIPLGEGTSTQPESEENRGWLDWLFGSGSRDIPVEQDSLYGNPPSINSDGTVNLQDDGTAGDAHFCGNGVLEDEEQCDDGNAENGDGCTTTCLADRESPVYTPACGNGLLDPGEACDDGNMLNDDSCSDTCTMVSVSSQQASQQANPPACLFRTERGFECIPRVNRDYCEGNGGVYYEKLAQCNEALRQRQDESIQ